MNRHSYWRTPELCLAAFVFARGGVLTGVFAVGKDVIFSFADEPECRAARHEFARSRALIDARIYAYALCRLTTCANNALEEFHGQN